MSFDLKASIERQDSRPASDDDLAIWAAEVWAMPESRLHLLAEKFEGVQVDASRTAEERAVAAHLLDALECALRGDVPPVETMRAAGLAVAAVNESSRDDDDEPDEPPPPGKSRNW